LAILKEPGAHTAVVGTTPPRRQVRYGWMMLNVSEMNRASPDVAMADGEDIIATILKM